MASAEVAVEPQNEEAPEEPQKEEAPEPLLLPVECRNASKEDNERNKAPNEQAQDGRDAPPSPVSDGRSPKVKSKYVTPQDQEHHQWAIEHWVRMDRDHDGFITRSELDSEEFRKALRSCLGAARTSGTSSKSMSSDYSRAKLNIDQAIDFVRRKADNNADSNIAFEEFESFTRSIRCGDAKSNAELIFALFDLDGDGAIDENEFREIYRYFLGHVPIEKDFRAEWTKLDMYGMQEVPKSVYVKWLQNSTNPVFKRHAPPALGKGATAEMTPYTKTAAQFPNDDMRTPKEARPKDAKTPLAPNRRRTPVLKNENSSIALQDKLDKLYGGGFMEKMDRPEWNRRHHLGGGTANDGKPVDQRVYFSRPQSLPELTRFYNTHRGFEKHSNRMKHEEPRRRQMILSCDTKENPVPGRDVPDGTMHSSKHHRVEPWMDRWQDPAWMIAKYTPGTSTLRLPGIIQTVYLDL